MMNPKVREHPHYDVTDKMREIYPLECQRWEKLLKDLSDPEKRGCFTCHFYKPIDNAGDTGFVDVEELDGCLLPWDTEQAYVWCDESPEIEVHLRIGCSLWKQYEPNG